VGRQGTTVGQWGTSCLASSVLIDIIVDKASSRQRVRRVDLGVYMVASFDQKR